MTEDLVVILMAFFLDVLIGDPRYPYHPIILMGNAINFFELLFNRGKFRFLKGLCSVLTIILLTLVSFFILKSIFEFIHINLGMFFVVYILYSCFALKSLNDHLQAVYTPLQANNLSQARLKLSYIVGRKTENLDRQEIIRASIETAAENLVDGVTAPLFFAFIFGAMGALLYKTVNTLDSMWGHRNKRFEHFGKFAAKLDDILNFLPARLTAVLIPCAGFFCNLHVKKGMIVLRRDGQKHPSPNSGLSEAAMAGTLDIRLGGDNDYDGHLLKGEIIGLGRSNLKLSDLQRAIYVINITTFLFLSVLVSLRVVVGIYFF